MLTMLPSDINSLIVTNPYNILYLSGFKGISDTEREAVLIVRGNKSIKGTGGLIATRSNLAVRPARFDLVLITAQLYQTEANKLKSKDLDIKIASERDQLQQFIFEALKGSQKIGFEKDNLTVAEHERYKALLPGKDFIATENIVESLRQIKTPDEVKKIEKAQIISQKALESLLPTIAVGQTEVELAHRLEAVMRSLGAPSVGFTTIVASGPNSGIPHHATGNRKIKKSDTLLFDFGAKYQNYCADFSRTVFMGKPSDRQVNIYNHVASAQKTAISKIQKEIKLKDAYGFANDIFKSANLHDYFTHGLGHGIGLEVHEAPHLRTTSEDAFDGGMVFSVEPGLYFPWGGVRIEDLVVIDNGKPRVLGKMQSGIVVV